MNHQYIEEQNVAERYLLSKLSADEETRFERHLIGCHECQTNLDTIGDFRQALKVAVVEDIARVRKLTPIHRRRRTLLQVCALLLLTALLTIYFVNENRRMRRELKQAQTNLIEWQQRYHSQQQGAQKVTEELRDVERRLNEQQRQLESLVQRETRMAHVPIFNLVTVRSIGITPTKSINQITIPHSSEWVVLSPELEDNPEVGFYHATLLTAQQQIIKQLFNLEPDSHGVLGLILPTNIFKTGNYRLELEGFTRNKGRLSKIRYLMHVTKQ